MPEPETVPAPDTGSLRMTGRNGVQLKIVFDAKTTSVTLTWLGDHFDQQAITLTEPTASMANFLGVAAQLVTLAAQPDGAEATASLELTHPAPQGGEAT